MGDKRRRVLELPTSREPFKNIKSKDDWDRYLREAVKSTQEKAQPVICFTTTWCDPCKQLENSMREAPKSKNTVKFAIVDVDCLLEVAKECKVKEVPTLLLLKPVESYDVDEGFARGDNSTVGNKEGSAVPGSFKKTDSMKNGDGINGVDKGTSGPGCSITYIRGAIVNDGKRVRIIEVDRVSGGLDANELRKQIQAWAERELRAVITAVAKG